MLFKDDKDVWVTHTVNATVIEGSAVSFRWGPNIAAGSLGVLPYQDQSHKHDLVSVSFGASVSV